MGDYYEYESDDNDDQKQPIHRKVYPIYGRDRERSDSSTYLTGSSSASANALMNFDSDSHCGMLHYSYYILQLFTTTRNLHISYSLQFCSMKIGRARVHTLKTLVVL